MNGTPSAYRKKELVFKTLDDYSEVDLQLGRRRNELMSKPIRDQQDMHDLDEIDALSSSINHSRARIETNYGLEVDAWRKSKKAPTEQVAPQQDQPVVGPFLKSLLPRASEWNTPEKRRAQMVGAVTAAADLPATALDITQAPVKWGLGKLLGRELPRYGKLLETTTGAIEQQAGLDPNRFAGAKVAGSLATPGFGFWGMLAKGGIPKLAAKGAAFGGVTEGARELTREGEVDPTRVAQAGVLGGVLNPALVKGAEKLFGLLKPRTGTTSSAPGGDAGPTPSPVEPATKLPSSGPVKAGQTTRVVPSPVRESISENAGAAAKEVAGEQTTSGKDLKGILGAKSPVTPPAEGVTAETGTIVAPPKVFGPPEAALAPKPQGLQRLLPGMGRAQAAIKGPMVQGPPEPPLGPARVPSEEFMPTRIEPGQRTFKGMGLRALMPREEGSVATMERPAPTSALAEAERGIAEEKALREQTKPLVEKPLPPKKAILEAEAEKARSKIIEEIAEKRKKESGEVEARNLPSVGGPVLKPVVTKFEGIQKDELGRPLFELHTLQEDIPLHPKGSTVSSNTLTKEGFVPQEGERVGKIAISQTKPKLGQPFSTTLEKGAPEAPYRKPGEGSYYKAPIPIKQKEEISPIDYDQHEKYFALRDSGVSAEEANKVIRTDIERTHAARLSSIEGQTWAVLNRAREAATKPKLLEPVKGALSLEEITKGDLTSIAEKLGYKIVKKTDPIYGESFEIRRQDGSVVGRGDDFDLRRIISNLNKGGALQEGGDAFYSGVPLPDFERTYGAYKLLGERKVYGGMHIQRKLGTPQFVYSDVPVAKEVTDVAANFFRDIARTVNQALYRYNEHTGEVRPTSLLIFDKADEKITSHINDFAWDLDKLSYKVTPKDLKAAGHSEEVIQTYFGLRGALNRLANKTEEARNKERSYYKMLSEEERVGGLAKKVLEIVKEPKEREVHLRDRRPNWLPRDWGGKFEIYKDGTIWVNPSTKESGIQTEWETATKLYDLKKAFPESKFGVKFYPDHDFQFSLDIEHALKTEKLAKIISERYSIDADELAALVVRSGSRKDFARRFLQRTGKEGYKTDDLKTIIQGHVFQAARYIAKVDLKINAHKLLSGEEAKVTLDKDTIDWLYSYISHVAGRETVADIALDNFIKSTKLGPFLDPSHPGTNLLRSAKQVTVHTKLGLLNVSYGLFNTSVIPLHVLPSLNRYGKLEGMGNVAGPTYTKYGLETYYKALIDKEPRAKAQVDKLVNEGIIQIHLMSQPLPQFTTKSKASDLSLLIAKGTEEATRTVAALGRYKMLRDQGITDSDALKRTYSFVNETMADFSAAGKAELFRGATGGTAFLFKNFGSVMMQNFVSNAVRTMLPKQGKRDPSTAAMYMTSIIALGGLIGVPLAKQADALLTSLTGFSPVQWLNDSLGEHGKALAYGASKYAGIYASARAGAGEVIPTDLKEVVSPGVFKPFWHALLDGLEDQSLGSAIEGFYEGLVNWLEPANLRVWKRSGVELANKELGTKIKLPAGLSGDTVYNRKNQVVIESLTPWEKFVYRSTFMPQRLGEAYDRERYIGNIRTEETQARKKILDILRVDPYNQEAWEKASERGMKPSQIQRTLREAELPLEERAKKHTLKKLRELYP